jgi:hypothetical protein
MFPPSTGLLLVVFEAVALVEVDCELHPANTTPNALITEIAAIPSLDFFLCINIPP